MRRFLLFIVILILLSSTGLFIYRQTHFKPSPTYSGEVQKISIANVGVFSILNLIAQEKGFFTDQGLDAQIIEYPTGPAAMTDLLAGKADFAISADFVGVSTIPTNKDLRIFTQVSKNKSFKVIGLKAKNITQPSDLKGKKIGVTRKGVGEYFLGEFLTFNGLEFKDVTVVDLPSTDIATQLQAGEIDAGVVFDPYAYNIQQTLNDQVVSWSAQGNHDAITLLFSTNTYLQSHPDIAERYLRALLQAENFSNLYPAEAKSILSQTMSYSDTYVEYIWPQFDFSLSLDQSLLLNMEDETRFRIKNNLTPETNIPNYLDYIYFNGLEKIKPMGISIIR